MVVDCSRCAKEVSSSENLLDSVVQIREESLLFCMEF